MGKAQQSSEAVETRRKKRAEAVPIMRKNPFEVRIARPKHAVLGKKSKSDKGLPGVSRSKAVEKRKNTLLKEYKQRNKTNMMVDKRFGEYDTNISAEDKMLKRFTLEKQRHHEKSGLYNLGDDDDDDGDGDVLTHFGQSLADIDNFDDAGLKLTDDEEDGDASDHFGGFLKKKTDGVDVDKIPGHKSKQDIMDDVVANSKKKKFERQQVQEEAFELTQKIDSEWKDIQALLMKRDDRAPVPVQKADDYDITVKQLAFESKANASDRLKTEEEQAKDIKAELVRLEEERKRRMLGSSDQNDEYTSSADAIVETSSKKDKRFEVHYKDGQMVLAEGMELFPPADDDGDGEESDGDNGEENDGDEDYLNVDDQNEEIEEEDEEEEDEESDHNDVLSEDESEDAIEDTPVDDTINDKKMDTIGPTDENNLDKELPFTFTAPESLDDLLGLVCERSFEEQKIIFDRIRKCHHVKLEADNSRKLQVFFKLLLDYIEYLCKQDTIPFTFINGLAGFLYDLCCDVRLGVIKIMHMKLKRVFKRIVLRLKLKGTSGMLPTLAEVIFLQLVSLIFPTSDLAHPITSPALVLISMVLSEAHLRSTKDVVHSALLLNVAYHYVKLSKRFLPEVITFLAKSIYQASETATPVPKTSASILNLRREEKNFLVLEKEFDTTPPPLNVGHIMSPCCEDSTVETDEIRLSCMASLYSICEKFSTLYSDVSCYHEVFHPIAGLLQRLPIEKYPENMKSTHVALVAKLLSKSSERRAPLTMQKRKPIPLPLLEPRFDEDYEIRPKRKAPNKQQNEREKLKYKLKKEEKNAVREIRKDASFLAKEQHKERQEKDADRLKKVKDLENTIAGERADVRKMEKGKTR